MIEVVLVMSPFAYSYSIPYQLCYLKAALKKHKLESQVMDFGIELYHKFDLFNKEDSSILNVMNWQERNHFAKELLPQIDEYIDECVDNILKIGARVIGFTVFNTNRNFCIELSRRLKKKNDKCRIVWGGVDCTISFNRGTYHFYENCFDENIVDAIALGEGDNLFIDLCQKQLPEKVNGAVTKQSMNDKDFILLPFIDDINCLPYPDYSDIKFDLYQGDVLPLSVSRGCNFHCTFCEIESLWLSTIRTRTAKSLFDELKYLGEVSSKKFVFLNGSYVNCNEGLLEEFSDRIIAEWGISPRFKWNAWARINTKLTKDILSKASAAGCYELVFGLESGSQKVINDMKKGFLIEDAEQVIANASRAGILITVFIIIGYPTETAQDFNLTLDFLARNKDFIRAAYCMSDCILSEKMMSDPEKYGVKKCHKIDAYEWTSVEGMTRKDRKKRLDLFYDHLQALGIEYG